MHKCPTIKLMMPCLVRQASRTALVVLAAVFVPSCKGEKKTSPDELIAAMAGTGVKVEKGGSFTNEAGWEMNMQLVLDGQDGYTAIRFGTTQLARDYCQTKKDGFAYDFWCVETGIDKAASHPSWRKVKAIAPKP